MNEINKYIEIGLINKLRVDSKNEYGYILKSQDEKQEAYIITEDEYTIGDVIEVFVFTSSRGKVHATVETPNTLRDQYNIFEIKEIKQDGVYVDWGIEKDLYIPNSHQNSKFRFGENRILKVVYDRDLKQLIGSEIFHKSLIKRTKDLKKMQSVDFMVLSKVPHGYKVIVENKYEATILSEDMEDKIFRIGLKFNGVVRMVKQDGSILVKFKQKKSKKRSNISSHIFNIVEKNNGQVSCGLKTAPEEIKEIFNLSKKSFKTSALDLMHEGVVELTDDYIKVI
jgi:predicted RNA-binding protein (virulence factor B family)